MAFDGNPDTFFWSGRRFEAGDRFTLTLKNPKAFQSVKTLTGSPDHPDDYLHEGALEVKYVGGDYEQAARFDKGTASVELKDKPLESVRLCADARQENWLIIREIELH